MFVSSNRFFGGPRSHTMSKIKSAVCVLLGSRLLGEVIAEMVYCLADAYMGCDWLVVASALPSCHHSYDRPVASCSYFTEIVVVATVVYGIGRRYVRCDAVAIIRLSVTFRDSYTHVRIIIHELLFTLLKNI